LSEGDEFISRKAAMAIVHRLRERAADAGTDTNKLGLLDAKLRRDLVGGAEADAADVAG